jgi:3,2-trans-enoyl-CoA isomerase
MINVIDHEGIFELSLARPPVNALTTEFLDELSRAYADVVANGAKAVVLSGREGLFSAGLDVPELLPRDRKDIEQFWSSFFELLNVFATSSIPVGAAITGHAPAGGLVLALYCDYRVAARGDFLLGLNEVKVGLQVPRNILSALEAVVGRRKAAWLATRGELVTPEHALECGMVDVLADPADVVDVCLAKARDLLELPPVAMNKTRLAVKSALLEQSAETASYTRVAVDAWFGDEAQRMLKELTESLKK